MQRLRNLAVDGARLDACLVPQLLRMLRRTLQIALRAEGLAVFQQTDLSDFMCQIIDILALGLDVPFVCDSLELFRVLDRDMSPPSFALIQGVADLDGHGRSALQSRPR